MSIMFGRVRSRGRCEASSKPCGKLELGKRQRPSWDRVQQELDVIIRHWG